MTSKYVEIDTPELKNALARLCANCTWNGRERDMMRQFKLPPYCSKSIPPLTLDGADCPYYQKQEVEKNDPGYY